MAVNKITIVGTGECASALASELVRGSLTKELMLIDLHGKRAQRLANDFKVLACANSSRMRIKGSSYAKALEGSDIVVVAPAAYCSDSDSKEQTFLNQLDAIKELSSTIKRSAPMALVLCASDFDDYLVVALEKYTGFAKERIMAIDPSVQAWALRCAIADKLDVNPADVDAHFKVYDDCVSAKVSIVGHDIIEFIPHERAEGIIAAVSKEFHTYTGKARYAYSQAYILNDFIDAIVNDHAIVRPVMSISHLEDDTMCLGNFSTVICRCGIKRVINSEANGYVNSKMKSRYKEIKKCMT